MKSTGIVFWAVAATGWLGAAEHHDPFTSGTNAIPLTTTYINRLMEELRTNHPAVRAAVARAQAANRNTNSVRVWEDPTFLFGGSVYSGKGMNPGEEGNLVYGIEQKLPLFGKAQAAQQLARTEAETEDARVTSQFQTLRRNLAEALFQLAGDDRALEIAARDLVWLDAMVATAEARLRSGGGNQVEVLRLLNDRAKRTDQLRTDSLRRDHSRLAINRLLNRELHSPLPQFNLPPVAGAVPYDSRLVDLAVANDPRLRVANREVRQAEARVTAARRSRLPDVGVGIDGRQYSGDGGFRQGTFMVNFSLPWFNEGRYRSDIARDRDRLHAAEFDAVDYQMSVREEVHHLTVNIDAARREALLYRDEIKPRSEQALASAHANWVAGPGMFNDVMEARRMLLESQSMYVSAVARQYQLMSELVLCCGLGDVEALESVGARIESGSVESPEPLREKP